MSTQHPIFRRLSWNPFVVAVLLAYLGYTAYLRGFPVMRVAGTGFVALWFGLSAYDMLTAHRLLDWMYSEGEREADKND